MIREISYVSVKNSLKTGDDRGFPSAENALKYYIEGRAYNKKSPEKEVFCSELIAETFIELGFFSSDYVANGYCPDDFEKGSNLPVLQACYFIDGARLNKWG